MSALLARWLVGWLAGSLPPLPMYFLPWIEAINLLKCSWPDILLVPLIDGLLAGERGRERGEGGCARSLARSGDATAT